ncbi:xanthine dehydrogenase family protein molybdopterin-binding subunit [Streptomyces sp. ISL-11]|uniref:xanthine dehydrogenase family protein molybdopterin-binding subunit n=1 Tax=Streptomyces sp. ISL-11 TaxID=2819174 RepID=UPI001BE5441B|nr:xanthine dehydrogenase family protein molybdopterin-binding subunit [Streptomyces sp. ISL-11]MBT2385704.1 xanthine dehydrogenase family protein molybdopterin-binding subunit [Streptomyces sp. ISL-11]
MTDTVGAPVVRADALAKVTGAARYAADATEPDAAYAALVTSAVARGRLTRLDTGAAEAVPGVRLVLTHRSPEAALLAGGFLTSGEPFQSSVNPLGSDGIHYAGQIIALVVADSAEAAEEAAHRVEADYDTLPARATLDEAMDGARAQERLAIDVGDTAAALRAAPVVVDAEYTTPAMHHNPIELYATTAVWRDDGLTVHVPSQWVRGTRAALAALFALPVERVRILSPYVGGGFGAKATVLWHTALVVVAARLLGRPVKLLVPRERMFTVGSFRPQTRHRVRLGADRDGRLLGYEHHAWGQNSRADTLALPGAELTSRFYAHPCISARDHVVPTDVNTPGFMRAPAEFPAVFALESAMDELAEALGVDPLALRLRNEPGRDPVTGLPFSSRSMVACYRRGAELFGWSGRDPRPGSMRDGEGRLVGWGCAASGYPVLRAPSRARVRLTADGRATVLAAAHDLGTGAYTVLAQIAARELGLSAEEVTVRLGDSDLPTGPMAGGSMTTASAGSAVKVAARAAGDRLKAMAEARGRTVAWTWAHLPGGSLEADGQWAPPELDAAAARQGLGADFGGFVAAGAVGDTHVMFSHGAQFVEVLVDPGTRRIRLGRMVGVFACGRIINPRTAYGQLAGGMIWGAGHALLEETSVDRALARFTNTDLGGYHIACNADIGEVTVETVDEHDEVVNPLGAKGVGELGIVGTAAAVANAVHHATGIRVRKTPILMDDILPPGPW